MQLHVESRRVVFSPDVRIAKHHELRPYGSAVVEEVELPTLPPSLLIHPNAGLSIELVNDGARAVDESACEMLSPMSLRPLRPEPPAFFDGPFFRFDMYEILALYSIFLSVYTCYFLLLLNSLVLFSKTFESLVVLHKRLDIARYSGLIAESLFSSLTDRMLHELGILRCAT